MNESLVNLVEQLGSVVEFRDGESLVTEGQLLDELIVVRSGSVAIEQSFPNHVVNLGKVDAGGVIGEVSFLDRLPASASAVANGNVVAMRVSGSELRNALQTNPIKAALVYAQLARILAMRLRNRTNETKRQLELLEEMVD